MSRFNRVALGVTALSTIVVLTACAGGAVGANPEPGGPTGGPIKLSVSAYIDTPIGSIPEVFSGAEVAADNINKAGGIDGRPLEIVTCNGKFDPRAEETCAREAANDAEVLATISNVFAVNPQGAFEAIDAGGLVDIGSVTGDPVLFTLPNMYPIEFPPAVTNACATKEAAGNSKIGVVVGQNPFSEGTFALMKPYLESAAVGDRYVGSVSVPETQQDFTPIVQELADKGADFIVSVINPAAANQIVTTASGSGHDWVFCADQGLFGAEITRQLAPMTKKFLAVSGFPSAEADFPLVKQFAKEMAEAEKAGDSGASLQVNHMNSLRSWLAVHVFAEVAGSLDGEITRDSLAKAMKTAKVDFGFAQLDFSKPLGTAPYERVFQPTAFINRWDSKADRFEQVAEVDLLELVVAP